MSQQEQDHYALLGVARGASGPEIRAAHARQLLAWHPDRAELNGLDPQAAGRRTQRLNVARDELLDPVRRAVYDAALSQREGMQARARAEQMRRQQERRAPRPRPQRGTDLEELRLLRRPRDVVVVSSAWGLEYRITEPGRYRIPYRGGAGSQGAPAGDLFVTVRRTPGLERAVVRAARRRALADLAGELAVASLWGSLVAMLLLVALALAADLLLI